MEWSKMQPVTTKKSDGSSTQKEQKPFQRGSKSSIVCRNGLWIGLDPPTATIMINLLGNPKMKLHQAPTKDWEGERMREGDRRRPLFFACDFLYESQFCIIHYSTALTLCVTRRWNFYTFHIALSNVLSTTFWLCHFFRCSSSSVVLFSVRLSCSS